MPTANNTQVGVLVVETPFSKDQSYETAAWYTVHQVPAGEYPVIFHSGDGRAWLRVTYPSVITDEYLGTLYGGVHVGKQSGKERVGKTSEVRESCGAYTFQDTVRPFSNRGKFVPTIEVLPQLGRWSDLEKRFTTTIIVDTIHAKSADNDATQSEVLSRIERLPDLKNKAGTAYTFYTVATKAIELAAGDPTAVDWHEVENITISLSVGRNSQAPQQVHEALCQISPGAVSASRQEAILRAAVETFGLINESEGKVHTGQEFTTP